MLRRLFRGLHEHSKAMLRRVGLSGPQVWALTIVDSQPGLSLGALAERMFAHPSTVSGVVDRLVERGALLRETNGKDRRGVQLSLTPLGRRLVRKGPSPIQSGLRAALESLPAPRLRELRRSLEEIVRATETGRLEAPFFDLEA